MRKQNKKTNKSEPTTSALPSSKIHVDISLLPEQRRIYDDYDKFRFSVIKMGRRAGKTMFVTLMIFIKCCQHKNFKACYLSPTYNMSLSVWDELMARFAPVMESCNKMERVMHLKNGSSVEFLTGESSDSGRGKKYDLLVLDECALLKNFDQLWQYSLRSTLIDTKGHCYFISTPKGSSNSFSKLYNYAIDHNREGWQAYSASTLSNFTLPKDELENLKLLPQDVYEQEVLGKVLPGTGSPFGNINDLLISESHIVDRTPTAIGIDLASKIDNSAIIFMNAQQQVIQSYVFQRSWIETKNDIINLCRGYRCPILADSTGVGAVVIEDLRVGLPTIEGFILTHQTKQEIIQNLILGVRNKRIWIPREFSILIDEMNNFESTLRNGAIFYEAGSGHDDTVIALALAYSKNIVQPLSINQFFVGRQSLQF